MNTFIERLVLEKVELEGKVKDLQHYLEHGNNIKQRDLLEKQVKAMRWYLEVLNERLDGMCKTLER